MRGSIRAHRPQRVRCARFQKSAQAAQARRQRARNAPLPPGRSESVVRGSSKILRFSIAVGLPVTFAEIGIPAPTAAPLAAVGRRATQPGETIHNEPMPVIAGMVVAAMDAADAAGRTMLAGR